MFAPCLQAHAQQLLVPTSPEHIPGRCVPVGAQQQVLHELRSMPLFAVCGLIQALGFTGKYACWCAAQILILIIGGV